MDRKRHRLESYIRVFALLAFIPVVLVGNIIVGCSPRILPPAEVKDSVRVEIRERVVHDTAIVEIPVIKEVNVTRDSLSHLENDYASSDAAIVDGMLHHTLASKPQRIYVPVEVPVHDTLIVEKKAETIIQKENYVTEWQSFQMILGRILGGLLLLAIALWAVKKFVLKR